MRAPALQLKELTPHRPQVLRQRQVCWVRRHVVQKQRKYKPWLLPFAGIRLAGATNDVHVFDVRNGKWEKIVPLGEPPSPRAAHAAAAVGNMVVIQVKLLWVHGC